MQKKYLTILFSFFTHLIKIIFTSQFFRHHSFYHSPNPPNAPALGWPTHPPTLLGANWIFTGGMMTRHRFPNNSVLSGFSLKCDLSSLRMMRLERPGKSFRLPIKEHIRNFPAIWHQLIKERQIHFHRINGRGKTTRGKHFRPYQQLYAAIKTAACPLPHDIYEPPPHPSGADNRAYRAADCVLRPNSAFGGTSDTLNSLSAIAGTSSRTELYHYQSWALIIMPNWYNLEIDFDGNIVNII